MESIQNKKKTRRNFWIVFSVLILLVAIASIGNLYEFNKVNRLDTEGVRIKCAVDSIVASGRNTEIFTRFSVGGKTYRVSKKVKTPVQKGDSVSVYYMDNDPSTNGIADE